MGRRGLTGRRPPVVIALVDRLVHRSEILSIDGESYRMKEARKRAARRATQRPAGKRLAPRGQSMQPNDLPIVCLPMVLSDEAAAALVDFLHELAEALESHYCGQLLRHAHHNNSLPSLPNEHPIA